MHRILAPAAFLALLLCTTASAQERRSTPDPKVQAAVEQLRSSITTWRSGTVLPRLREWKGELDRSLSPADLSALNDLRSRARTLRARRNELVKGMREAWRAGEVERAGEYRNQIRALAPDRDAILTALRPIAERSRTTLESIGSRARPVIAGWREEARGMVERWLEENRDLLGNNPYPWRAGRLARLFWPERIGEGGKRRAVVRFMLWDGGEIEGAEENSREVMDDPTID